MLDWVPEWLATDAVGAWLRAAIMVLAGIVGSRLAGGLVFRLLSKDGRMERATLARNVAYTGVLILAVLSALSELGFDLSILLGAAGIASVAVGFASQTSASNLISGLFLIAERPFSIGDIIEVGGRSGVVLEVDLLSIKLRTFDNRFVRIPNETVMKSDVVNLTRFAIRRIDLALTVPHTIDLPRVRAVLAEVATGTTLVLDEPKAEVIIQGFSPQGTDLLLVAWVDRTNLIAVRNDLILQIHQRLGEENIDLSPRQKTIFSGEAE